MKHDRELTGLEQEIFDEFTELVRKQPEMDVDAYLSRHPPTSLALRDVCLTAAVVARAAALERERPRIL